MLTRVLPSVTTWLPRSLVSLTLHCQSQNAVQHEDIYDSFEDFRHFVAHDNNELENLSVNCHGGYWNSQQYDAVWTSLGPGTTWLQTLRVLNLRKQAVRYDVMEAFVNASQLRELEIAESYLKNQFSREGWVAISHKMGGRLKSLQLVTLVNITDTITLKTKTRESGPYLDNNTLLTICHNFLVSVPSDRVAICKVWDGGVSTKLDRALDG